MESKSTRILVVEDDANDSFMLIRQLEKAEIDDNATVVVDGEKALQHLTTAPRLPLAVFLDLRLPGLSGIEVLEKIRDDARCKELPVIIMTGSTDPDDVRKCEKLGVTAFLEKPVALTSFIKTVAHLFPKASTQE
jgi:CheY-like chemotaxis protein